MRVHRVEAALSAGAEHHRAGRWKEAAEEYTTALRMAPERTDAAALLGAVLIRLDRTPEAVQLLERAHARDPLDALAALNLGRALLRVDRAPDAERAFAAALAARPGFPEAAAGRCRALLALGSFPAAAALARELGDGSLLAAAQLGAGDGEAAIATLRAALGRPGVSVTGRAALEADLTRCLIHAGNIALNKGDPEAVALYSEALPAHAAAIGLADALYRHPRATVATTALLAVLADDGVDHQRMAAALAAAMVRESGGDPEKASRTTLFAPWLRRTIVVDRGWRAALDVLRTRWASADPGVLPAARQALAIQDGWTEDAPDSAGAAEEDALAANMARSGASTDATSAAVRAAYDANPYPRLVGVHLREPAPFAQRVPVHVPDHGPRRVLVAGAGTGQHPIQLAASLADVEVVAIDLSARALARATRASRGHGIQNLRFIQADLLDPGDIGTYDWIDCVGVLHHLADPLAGGRALCRRLRPGGLLRLGLYSERGRADVVTARARAARLGWLPTDAGLREARRGLLDLPGLTGSVDYWSQSGLRDLVFHPCEHRYTPLQVGALLCALDLELVAMQHARVEPQHLYRRQWPDDTAQLDLSRWDTLEAEEPWIFAGMIHVWARPTGI